MKRRERTVSVYEKETERKRIMTRREKRAFRSQIEKEIEKVKENENREKRVVVQQST